MSAAHYLSALGGIAGREVLRFVKQRERFLSALVRPLVWLIVFAAGFVSPAMLHNATHDTRHAFGLPCH